MKRAQLTFADLKDREKKPNKPRHVGRLWNLERVGNRSSLRGFGKASDLLTSQLVPSEVPARPLTATELSHNTFVLFKPLILCELAT